MLMKAINHNSKHLNCSSCHGFSFVPPQKILEFITNDIYAFQFHKKRRCKQCDLKSLSHSWEESERGSELIAIDEYQRRDRKQIEPYSIVFHHKIENWIISNCFVCQHLTFNPEIFCYRIINDSLLFYPYHQIHTSRNNNINSNSNSKHNADNWKNRFKFCLSLLSSILLLLNDDGK